MPRHGGVAGCGVGGTGALIWSVVMPEAYDHPRGCAGVDSHTIVLTSVLLAGAGAVVLTLSIFWARLPGDPPGRDARTSVPINRLPGWLYGILWLPMQLGNLVVGCLAGALFALWKHDLGVALAVVIATMAKLVVERIVRREMAAYLKVRQRPGTSEPGRSCAATCPSQARASRQVT